jgi:hypothetical protein
MKDFLKKWWPIGWLTLFWFVSYSPLLFFHRWIHWDLIMFFFPHLIFAEDMFRSGQLPLWNPFQECGMPFFSNPQSHIWYLPNQVIIWTVGYSIRSLQYELLFHNLAAGITSYVLARKLKLSKEASALAATSYMLSGIFTGNAEHFNAIVCFVWLPLAMAGLLGWFAEARKPDLWLLGVSLFFMLTGGHFGPDLIAFLFLGALVLINLVESIKAHGLKDAVNNRLIPLAFAAITPALIAGVYLVPVFDDLAAFTNRGSPLPFHYAVDYNALPVWGLLSLVLPASPFASALYPKWESISMLNCYFGIIALCLALFAVYAKRTRPVVIFAVLGCAGLAFALGGRGALRGLLYDILPFYKVFLHPALSRGIFILFFCLLAGLGLDRLLKEDAKSVKSFRVAVLLLMLVLSVWLGFAGALLLADRKINVEASQTIRHAYLESLPIQIIILLALYFWFRGSKKYWAIGILFLSSLDLCLMAQGNMDIIGEYIKAEDAKTFEQTFFVKVPGRDRNVVNYNWAGRIDNYGEDDNTGEVFKKFQTWSYGPRKSPDYASVMDTGFHKVVGKFPRFFLAPAVSVQRDLEPALPIFSKAAEKGAIPAIVNELPPLEIKVTPDAEYSLEEVSGDRIKVVNFSANRLEVEFYSDRPMLFASTERYHRGWVATLDGKPVPTIKVNFVFRGVYATTPGAHRLVWEFKPKSLYWGLGASMLGLLMLCALIVISALKVRRAGHHA